MPMTKTGFPRAVLFDLLTALLDSWSLWDAVAGSQEAGRAWRAEYLRLTYGCGAYVPYEHLVRAGKADRVDHIGDAGAARDERRPLVDHGVKNLAGRVIAIIAGTE